jgi:hypothetical protein
MVLLMRYALSIAGALMIGTTAFAQVTPLLRPFKDVPASHPNYEAILWLQANGIVQGALFRGSPTAVTGPRAVSTVPSSPRSSWRRSRSKR